MKLFIQIPCYNEEKTLPTTLSDLPTHIDGISEIEVVIIDDGSSDRTVEIARQLGVNHIIQFNQNRGLAKAFITGLRYAVEHGADIIVNTDGDNQYKGEDIPKLIQPILRSQAEMVIGVRNMSQIPHFSPIKKILQRLGSRVVSRLAKVSIEDVTSGFRAISRDAAMKLQIFSDYTFTLETIIQAGRMDIAIKTIPIITNPKTRESRLIVSIPRYILISIGTMFRIYVMYEPLKFFVRLSILLITAGALIGIRFLYYLFTVTGDTGREQSLILAAILIILGGLLFLIGVISDSIAGNRKLIQESLYKIKQIEKKMKNP